MVFTIARSSVALSSSNRVVGSNWLCSVFGWVGASDRLLVKYVDVFARLGAKDSIRTVAPTFDVLARPAAVRLLAEKWLLTLESQYPSRPTVALLCSNGGAFVYAEAVDVLAADALLPKNQRRFSRVAIRATIFDSSPAWISPQTGARAFSDGRESPVMRAILYASAYSLFSIAWPLGAGRKNIPFFETLRTNASNAPSLYIYSDIDRVTNSMKLREHISQRRLVHTSGRECVQELITQAPHCGHLRDEPVKYEKAVADLLHLANQRHEKEIEVEKASREVV